MRGVVRAVCRALPLLAVWAGLAHAQAQVLIVSGLGGEKEFSDNFYEWGAAMVDAAQRAGVPRDHIQFLAEDTTRDRARVSGRSTKEAVGRAVDRIAAATKAGDVVLILLIGHGSMQADESFLSMPGPDMSAKDFAAELDKLADRKVAFVNAASGSGDFLPVLSGPNRVIVTATKTGFERNESRFARFFVRAFTGEGADTDKDGRVSVLEAFEYARQEVARFYESDNQIMTEHALLDDNGDRTGSMEPEPRQGDGMVARGVFLSPQLTAGAHADPRLPALYREKQVIEDSLDALRRAKATLASAEYEKRLEDLLVSLAAKTQEIKKIEGGGAPPPP